MYVELYLLRNVALLHVKDTNPTTYIYIHIFLNKTMLNNIC